MPPHDCHYTHLTNKRYKEKLQSAIRENQNLLCYMIDKSRISFTFLLVFLLSGLQGQDLNSILDFLTLHPNKAAVMQDSTIYPAKAIFTPVISFAPETNLSIGVGMKGLFKMKGSGDETRTSNLPLTAQYTIENKFLFFSGFGIFSPQEKYMLTGNIRIQSFPSLYFGVGPDTPKSNEEEFSYRQILLQPLFLKNLFRRYLFFGGGIRYNRISGVEPQADGLLATTAQSGARGSTSSGLELAVIYDSRDNLLNATKGYFISLTHGFYTSWLGSSHEFQLTKLDFRYFMQPLGNPSSILGIQFLSQISQGDTPLHELGRLGGDVIMRGYFEGRYTDRHLITTQVEWRQKLTHRWGAVAFAGIGDVAPTLSAFDLNTIRASYGVGLRFLVDEEENLNIRFDLGVGNEKVNYYFKIAEAF